MNQNAIARRDLDEVLAGKDRHACEPPRVGGLRAIRRALGMTTRQVARRAGVTYTTIAKIERSESAGNVQIATLRRVADALECDLVYALVPRTSLDDSVRRQAMLRARRDMENVDRTMRLEGQGLSAEQLQRRLEQYAAELVDTAGLWDE